MEDHINYFKSRSQRENMLTQSNDVVLMTSKEKDCLLIDLVKSYPHLYDKECKDFKDVSKRNNSWKEIAQILNATGMEHIFLYQYCHI